MQQKGKQFSSRLWAPYDELVVEKARVARLKPTELVRMAVMSFVDPDYLSFHRRLGKIEDVLLALRRDFDSAVRGAPTRPSQVEQTAEFSPFKDS